MGSVADRSTPLRGLRFEFGGRFGLLWGVQRATLQLVILASIGISVLVGYSLASIRKALIALLLAQLVGFPVGLSTCSSILTRPVSTHTRPVIILVDRAR